MSKERISVLVVEDEALVRMGIVDYLEDQGFRVFEAENAEGAIGLLATFPEISVLFTDVDMPGAMDGFRLAAAVRDRWPPIEIIVTSGHARGNPADLPDRAVFLSKPYDPQLIAKTVRQLAL